MIIHALCRGCVGGEMKNQVNFTLKLLGNLSCPLNLRQLRVYDVKTRGLALRITPSGQKTYIFYRRLPDNNESARRIVELTLGRFEDLTIENARIKCNELNTLVGQGLDPSKLQQQRKTELTYGDLFTIYLNEYAKLFTATWKEAEGIHARHFDCWKNKPISKIQRNEVQKWIFKVAGESCKKSAAANRSFDQMKAVINYGIRKNLIAADNPCVGVDKLPTKSRERFLQPGQEYAQFADALSQESNQTLQDFFWIALFVGARRGNVLEMAWDQISFEFETWTIPKTKNGDSLTVPLTPKAMQILLQRVRAADKHPIWVFPSNRKGRKTGEIGHIGNPKAAWKRLLERAKIDDLHIHDLRRTAGSYMAIQGVSTTIIGKALGHRSQASTAPYARLTQDPVRQAMINAQSIFSRLPSSSFVTDEDCI